MHVCSVRTRRSALLPSRLNINTTPLVLHGTCLPVGGTLSLPVTALVLHTEVQHPPLRPKRMIVLGRLLPTPPHPLHSRLGTLPTGNLPKDEVAPGDLLPVRPGRPLPLRRRALLLFRPPLVALLRARFPCSILVKSAVVRRCPHLVWLLVSYTCRYRRCAMSWGRSPPLLTAVMYRAFLRPAPNMDICRTWPRLTLRVLSSNRLIPRLGRALVSIQHPRVSLTCIPLTPLTVRPSAEKKWPMLLPLGQTSHLPRRLGPRHSV